MFWKVVKWGGTAIVVVGLVVALVAGQTSGEVKAPPVVQKPVPGGKNFNF